MSKTKLSFLNTSKVEIKKEPIETISYYRVIQYDAGVKTNNETLMFTAANGVKTELIGIFAIYIRYAQANSAQVILKTSAGIRYCQIDTIPSGNQDCYGSENFLQMPIQMLEGESCYMNYYSTDASGVQYISVFVKETRKVA